MIDISVKMNGSQIAYMHVSPKELLEKSKDKKSKWRYLWFYSQLMSKENVGGEIDAWAQDGIINLVKDILDKVSSNEDVQKFTTHVDPQEIEEETKDEQKEESIIQVN